MSAGAVGEPRGTVEEAVLPWVERGDWRPARQLDRRLPAGRDRRLGWAGLLAVVGRAMCARANGHPADAWAELDRAASHLPRAMRKYRADGVVLARLLGPGGHDPLARRIAAVVWREQRELIALGERLRRCETARRSAGCAAPGRAARRLRLSVAPPPSPRAPRLGRCG